jgi:hypothetical protein
VEKEEIISSTKVPDQNLEISGNVKQAEVVMDTPEP